MLKIVPTTSTEMSAKHYDLFLKRRHLMRLHGAQAVTTFGRRRWIDSPKFIPKTPLSISICTNITLNRIIQDHTSTMPSHLRMAIHSRRLIYKSCKSHQHHISELCLGSHRMEMPKSLGSQLQATRLWAYTIEDNSSEPIQSLRGHDQKLRAMAGETGIGWTNSDNFSKPMNTSAT